MEKYAWISDGFVCYGDEPFVELRRREATRTDWCGPSDWSEIISKTEEWISEEDARKEPFCKALPDGKVEVTHREFSKEVVIYNEYIHTLTESHKDIWELKETKHPSIGYNKSRTLSKEIRDRKPSDEVQRTASELIADLQKMIAEHGDIVVKIGASGGGEGHGGDNAYMRFDKDRRHGNRITIWGFEDEYED